MNTVKSYVADLRKTKTLAEIAALTSVSQERLVKYSKDDTIHPSYKHFKSILSVWCREVYCHG